MQSRRQAKENAGAESEEQRKPEPRRVDAGLRKARNALAAERQHDAQNTFSQERAGRASQNGQQQTFSQQLPDHSPAPGDNGGAHCHFLLVGRAEISRKAGGFPQSGAAEPL